MNIQGIDHVAINVRDLDKAVEFYTQILGLKITEREYNKPGIEYFLDVGTNGRSLIGLIQGDPKGPEHPFMHEGIGANHFSFRIASKDFDQTHEFLKSKGVEILHAKKREKSWSLYFKDLDGNKLEITAWPLED